MSGTTTAPPLEMGFEQHAVRGPLNAAFFRVMDPYIERKLRSIKQHLFNGLPRQVVEIGPGVGANLRYLPVASTLVAIEPNRHMHRPLTAAARQHGVRLDLWEFMAEQTGLPDDCADAVISSLVLCSVQDPDAVLTEVRRILRPGGTFRFLEHVAAPPGTMTRAAQRILRRPWAWIFEGCSCERDLERSLRSAGFRSITIDRYRVHTPFLPFNTHIAGIAQA
ncbi:class I SAM-dependent methyltransferase [Microbacterium sp. SS28]|uniref:class I SAM-dependent methyltransferase n=1 Tax=Microbacterium sp. SS28 TaxID=2919948 RepID=UPI001FAAFE48|nr:class I SAM-dependent methyltransferase [Microbacterium sp. SS28]